MLFTQNHFWAFAQIILSVKMKVCLSGNVSRVYMNFVGLRQLTWRTHSCVRLLQCVCNTQEELINGNDCRGAFKEQWEKEFEAAFLQPLELTAHFLNITINFPINTDLHRILIIKMAALNKRLFSLLEDSEQARHRGSLLGRSFRSLQPSHSKISSCLRTPMPPDVHAWWTFLTSEKLNFTVEQLDLQQRGLKHSCLKHK